MLLQAALRVMDLAWGPAFAHQLYINTPRESCLTTSTDSQVKVMLQPTISRSVSPGFEPHVGLVAGYKFIDVLI
jgi:hypothetical protein